MRGFIQAVHEASAFHGEFKRTLLSASIVGFILLVAWAVQEWKVRNSAVALGWFGVGCMCLVGVGATALVVVGLL